MEENIEKQPIFRLNIKQNSKGEKYYDLTARADTIAELEVRIQQLQALAEEQIKK